MNKGLGSPANSGEETVSIGPESSTLEHICGLMELGMGLLFTMNKEN